MSNINSITAILFSLITCFLSTSSFAQNYPNKPITVIVPFSAGSASDVVTRVLLEKVSNNTGTRFVFDNRPAAGGNVGTAALVRAEPDG
jgi:tripartite-type tricarboxylate transporter receptor subunit TctC